MKPLFTQDEFNNAKSTDKLPCECYHCGGIGYHQKNNIKLVLDGITPNDRKYCSTKCKYDASNKQLIINCDNCQISFMKRQSEFKDSKKHFCSRSCAVTYNNKNKTHGTRRSKLEIYLEEQLSILYPNIEIHFNRKDTIGSELDIFIPSLNIAFELNGIFHYEPIYGVDKLNKIQNNDKNKFHLCSEHKIDLCIIDTSQQKYIKPSTSQKYLDIITKIINERLLTS